jgi:hypothetical protein
MRYLLQRIEKNLPRRREGREVTLKDGLKKKWFSFLCGLAPLRENWFLLLTQKAS